MPSRFPRPLLLAALTVAISVVVTVYAVEILLYAMRPTQQLSPSVHLPTQAFDTRDVWQVVTELRRVHREVYPSIAPAQFLAEDGLPARGGGRLLPLGGVARAVNAGCNESGTYSVHVNDRHGFNNPATEVYEQADVLVVGDSFAQGACVTPPADVGGRLREHGYRVVNIGMGGNGPIVELAGLREFGHTLKPKVVVWLYFEGNDVAELSFEKRAPTAMRYLDSSFAQGLAGRQAEVDDALRAYMERFERERLSRPAATAQPDRPGIGSVLQLKEIRHLIYEARLLLGFNVYGREWDDNLVLLERVLATARRDVADWGGRLLFVYLPAQDRYTSFFRVGNPHLHRRDQVLAIARRQGLDVLDFHAALTARGDPLRFFPFRAWGHYTAEGYEALGVEIARILAAQGAHPAVPR